MTQELSLNARSMEDLINSNLTENKLNELNPKTRLAVCVEKIKNGRNSESQRWDCLIIISELYVKLSENQFPGISNGETKEMLSEIESTLITLFGIGRSMEPRPTISNLCFIP